MKQLSIFRTDEGIVLERENEFRANFKRAFATENGLLEALEVYRTTGILDEYELTVSKELQPLLIRYLKEETPTDETDLRLYEYFEDLHEWHYVEVDSNYVNPPEGKDKEDAVSFLMGILNKELTIAINVSTEEARRFAQSVLAVCDKIEGESV